jgi:flavorubredoxin
LPTDVPTGGQQYVDEIKKVTDKPIKYLIYSHVHFDHIAGGKAFKDAGARVIAHKNATARLKVLKDPHTVMPDESIGDKKTIKLGGTTLELSYLGLNHSDSTLVMRLPKERSCSSSTRSRSARSRAAASSTSIRSRPRSSSRR